MWFFFYSGWSSVACLHRRISSFNSWRNRNGPRTTHQNGAGEMFVSLVSCSCLQCHVTETTSGVRLYKTWRHKLKFQLPFVIFLQVAARCLGIPASKIIISETSTNTVPNTTQTAASASSDLNGMAVKVRIVNTFFAQKRSFYEICTYRIKTKKFDMNNHSRNKQLRKPIELN